MCTRVGLYAVCMADYACCCGDPSNDLRLLFACFLARANVLQQTTWRATYVLIAVIGVVIVYAASRKRKPAHAALHANRRKSTRVNRGQHSKRLVTL